MAGCGERADAGVPELDLVAVAEFFVRELDAGSCWKVGRRACRLDERRKPGDVIRLHVRLEDRGDRRSDAVGLGQVLVDERLMRIDDGELAAAEAAEEIGRAGGLREEVRTENHGRSLGVGRKS